MRHVPLMVWSSHVKEHASPAAVAEAAQAWTAAWSGGGGAGMQISGPPPGSAWHVPECCVPSSCSVQVAPEAMLAHAATAGAVGEGAGRHASVERIPNARQIPVKVRSSSVNEQEAPACCDVHAATMGGGGGGGGKHASVPPNGSAVHVPVKE